MLPSFLLRPSQLEILRYRGGKMGIAAVPGSGKTFTLSALAAEIIARGLLADDQEVLIVTLVNSAVENFETRIRSFFPERVQALYRYRVRTLHGLAHDIVRERPALAGLDERFQILDEREAGLILQDAVRAWMSANAYRLEEYLHPDLEPSRRDWVLREPLPDLLNDIALAFIRSAKDARLEPDDLRRLLRQAPAPLPLAEMGTDIYADYQRALRYRGAVDFDDLVRLAYQVLESDPQYLARLQYRFPYILEDEAQDSSRLQEEILRLLAGHGNWVRVGDPNQAIYETFTTANPALLRAFIESEADESKELPVSGRSQPLIIDLANFLIDWVNHAHPAPACRDALLPPYIRPTGPDDPQPNPPLDLEAVRIITRKYTPEEEVRAVVASLKKWLPTHQDWTVAVLTPRNTRGFEVVDALKKEGIETVELISSTDETRRAAGALGNLLAYLADPTNPLKLARAYQVWRRQWREEETQHGLYQRVAAHLRKLRHVEAYLNPLYLSEERLEDEAMLEELELFRQRVHFWQAAVLLPIDQLLLTLAQDLFTEPSDLALAHKLALALKQAAESHADWRLPELTDELALIARNERRFLGFSGNDTGFDPEAHRGKVVVATMHKAKGLEWDRVYLMSVNNYDFPSLQPGDRYIAEKSFVRGQLNLQAEALAQLQALLHPDEFHWYEEGQATLQSRVDYVRERLRLLYVGITRARRELIITWNTGRHGDARPALPLQALAGWLKERQGK